MAHVAGSDVKRSSERLIDLLAASVAGVGSNNAWLGGGQAVIVLTPDHIGELAEAGHDRSSTTAAIGERATTRDGRPAFESADDVLLVAAGGSGSTAMSSRPGVQGRTATGLSPVRSTSARPVPFPSADASSVRRRVGVEGCLDDVAEAVGVVDAAGSIMIPTSRRPQRHQVARMALQPA